MLFLDRVQKTVLHPFNALQRGLFELRVQAFEDFTQTQLKGAALLTIQKHSPARGAAGIQ